MLAVPAGDELQLKHSCTGRDHKPWKGSGIVIKMSDATEEVALELRSALSEFAGLVPAIPSLAGWPHVGVNSVHYSLCID